MIQRDRTRLLDRFIHAFVADPQASIPRHCKTQKTEADEILNICGIQAGHRQCCQSLLGLVRCGRRFPRMIIPVNHQNATVFGAACEVSVAQCITGTFNAGALTIPDGEYAFDILAGQGINLLRPPNRCRGQFFIKPQLENHIRRFQMLARFVNQRVVSANWRAAITGNEAPGV